MTFESKILKQFTHINEQEHSTQYVLAIMQYGTSIQLVKQEYWFDEKSNCFKPGKLKGFNNKDLARLQEIGFDKIVNYIDKHSQK